MRIDEEITFKEAMLFIPNRVSEDLIFFIDIQPISFIYFHEDSWRQACLYPEIKGAFTESLFLFPEVFRKKELHKVPPNDYSLR